MLLYPSAVDPNSPSAAQQLPSPMCFAKLLKRAFDGEDLKPLRDRLIVQLNCAPSERAAVLMSLSVIEQVLGDQPSGLRYQDEALKLHRLYRSPWHASPDALRVLAFRAPGDISTNTPVEFLLEGSDVILYSLYIVPGQPVPPVPEHDIAIFTVGESDRDLPVVREVERLSQHWPCPILNRPQSIPHLSREGMYRLLRDVPGVVMPVTVRVNRAAFQKLAGGMASLNQSPDGIGFPIIVRPVGSHAGRGLAKLDAVAAIPTYLAEQTAEEFFLSPFVDYRSADGQFRKYRVIWVDRRPYPCHMAISDQWKVWYYNAGMSDSAAKRDEEAQFMTAFDEGFARRHAAALDAMAERFDLDYVGIDCAELPGGRLLVFEGDISLVVHDMDPPAVYPYKTGPTQKLFRAFFDMLKAKRK